MAMQQMHTPLQSPDEYLDLYSGFSVKYGITNKRRQGMGECDLICEEERRKIRMNCCLSPVVA